MEVYCGIVYCSSPILKDNCKEAKSDPLQSNKCIIVGNNIATI